MPLKQKLNEVRLPDCADTERVYMHKAMCFCMQKIHEIRSFSFILSLKNSNIFLHISTTSLYLSYLNFSILFTIPFLLLFYYNPQSTRFWH